MLTVVPVAKADPDIDRIAARLEPAMRRAFLAMVDAFRDAIPLDVLAAAFEAVDFAAVREALAAAAIPPDTVAAFNDVLAQALTNTAAPTAAAFGLSFTLDNPLAVTWIDRHGAELVVEITEETRRAIADVIRRGVIEGVPPRSQGRMLRNMIGLTTRDAGAVRNLAAMLADEGVAAGRIDEQVARYAARLLRRRAENIARTETMFAANRGQLAAWQYAADEGLLSRETTRRVWIVTTDERLCPLCAPMEGVTVGLESSFVSDTEATSFTVTSRTGEERIAVGESRPRKQPVSTVTPPLHPSCFPGDTLVLPVGRVVAATKRIHRGDLVVIRRRNSDNLRATPNHPILTSRGWVPARLLIPGDQLVSAPNVERGPTSHMHDGDVPTRIEQVAETFLHAGSVTSSPVPVAPIDFHGDGAHSDVAVVGTNCLLVDDVHVAASQPRSELEFVRGGVLPPVGLYRGRNPHLFLGSPLAPSRRFVRRRHLVSSLCRRHASPLHSLRFGPASDMDAPFLESPPDDPAADPEIVRQRLLGFAGNVSLDEVVDVQAVPFHGPVYNLETTTGFYLADSVAVHNCRCTTGLVFG